MKLNILFVIISIFILSACEFIQSKEVVVKSKNSNISSTLISDSTRGNIISVRDIGKLKHGEVVAIEFAIKNGFDKPLIVNSVESSCGCVSVEYKPTPLKKGDDMVFNLKYNSLNRFGTQFANVTINTNHGEYIYRLEVFVETN